MQTKIFSFHDFESDYYPEEVNGISFSRTYDRLTAETCRQAEGCQAVCLFTSDDASAPVLEQLHKLGVKYLALRSAGYNHADLTKAAALGMKVANVPAYSPYAIAEHSAAMMLALNRKLILADQRIKRHDFRLNGLTGFDMRGKTVGIAGLGFIGKALASIMHGFGCNILGFDLEPDPELEQKYNLKYTDLDTLCRESDIISLHIPLTPQTKYLINAQRIALMKPGVMLINTARGGIVETAAVIDALKTGQIGSFGMDVYEKETGVFFYDFSETILEDDTLALLTTFPNVLITAHQAFLTETALQNIADTTTENLTNWAMGKESESELT